MTESPELPWKRFATEAFVIVLSILLAFAIDAWWEERRDRQAERVLLQRLRADFLEIQAGLRVVELEHVASRDASISLLGMPHGEPVPATPEADRMVALVFLAVRTFNPGSGAVASFLHGDGAQLIRHQALSDKLLAWPGAVAELQEEELSMQKASSERWTPFLAERVSLGPYFAAFGDIARDIPERVAAPRARNPLVVDRAFLNHVVERYKWQQVTLRDLVLARTALEEILGLLEDELE